LLAAAKPLTDVEADLSWPRHRASGDVARAHGQDFRSN
jgi:hypothetical protein